MPALQFTAVQQGMWPKLRPGLILCVYGHVVSSRRIVRDTHFQGGNTGSNPVRDATYSQVTYDRLAYEQYRGLPGD